MFENLSRDIQAQNDLVCGLCRRCRSFARCRNTGRCAATKELIPADQVALMRAAQAWLLSGEKEGQDG